MHKLKHIFLRFWNRFEALCTVESDSERERRRKLTLVVIALLSCITGIVSGTRNLVVAGFNHEVLIPYSYTIIVGSALILFFITRRFSVLLYPFLITMLCIPCLFQLSIGGMTVPGAPDIILWSLLAPIGSLMFQGTKKAIGWFLVFLIFVTICLILDDIFLTQPKHALYSLYIVGHGINLYTISITIFITMLYFVNAFQKEYARAEKALQKLKETQATLIHSEKMASLGKLVAGLAHEFNTPIGAIKSATDSIERSANKIQDEHAEKFEENHSFQNSWKILHDSRTVATESCERISSLLGSLRNFIHLDESEFQKIDIHESLEDTLHLAESEFSDRICIVKEYGDIPAIEGYPGELNQVFMNIITNAVQAIEKKGTITIRTTTNDKEIHISITDTGRGIPQEKLRTLFEPEFTRDGPRVKASLGLFTSDNIIQKHNGRIDIRSEPGKGSTFTIIIPSNT